MSFVNGEIIFLKMHEQLIQKKYFGDSLLFRCWTAKAWNSTSPSKLVQISPNWPTSWKVPLVVGVLSWDRYKVMSNLKCFLEIDNVRSKVLTVRLTPLILKPWNMWPSLRLTGIIVPVPSLSSPYDLMSSHIRSIAFDLSKSIIFCSCDLQYIIKMCNISYNDIWLWSSI